MESTISVDGRGSIHVVPDVTRLEVCVESVFVTYEDAYKQARENAKCPYPVNFKTVNDHIYSMEEFMDEILNQAK